MSQKKTMRKMNPPNSSTSSSYSFSSVSSLSKPLEDSDNDEEYNSLITSQQNELAVQADRIASLETIIRELTANQAPRNNINEITISSNIESNKQPIITIETRSVPKKNYLITSASVSKMLLAN